MADRDRNQWAGRDWFSATPFAGMQREMSRWVDDLLRAFPAGSGVPVRKPSLDVRESDDELCVIADLPGAVPSSIDVRIDGSTLIISAERQTDSATQYQNYHVSERRQGLLQRSVRLPFGPDPDAVRANYSNGVLTVRIPKRGQRLPGRRINVECTDANAGDSTSEARTETRAHAEPNPTSGDSGPA
jgi:HSP20 family protein